MDTETVVNFTSIDGTHFKMPAALRLVYVQGDTKPESNAGRLALELFLFRGCSRTTKRQSFVAQVRLMQLNTGAVKNWGAESPDPNMVLLAVDQFNVRRLLPDGLPAPKRETEAQELEADFERSNAKFQVEAKRQLA
jgi:hypothetical protein